MAKKIFIVIALCFGLAYRVFGADVVILHTNDMHCALDSGVELSGVSWLKKVYQGAGIPVALVDAGDAVQGSPLGSLTEGKAVVRLMNVAEYDFAVPGNHEFDYGLDQFKFLNELLSCHYYSANIFERKKLMLQAYKMMELGGSKFAFVGITTPLTLVSSRPSTFVDPQKTSKQIVTFGEKELSKIIQKTINQAKKNGAQKVILVAHLGNNVSGITIRSLVKNLHGIDVIIDGHSHENYVEQMEDVTGKKIFVTQTGTKLQSLGRIIFKDDGKIVVDKLFQLTGQDEVVVEELQKEKERFEDVLMATVGHLGYSLYIANPDTGERLCRKIETNLGDFVTDAFRNVLNTDVSVINGGGLRSNLYAGILNYRDILSVFPFCDRLSVVKMTGKQLLDMLEFSVKSCPKEFGGFLQVSGITFDVNVNVESPVITDEKGMFIKIKNGPRRVSNVMINDVPLLLGKEYTICGNDFLFKDGGDGYGKLIVRKLDRETLLTDGDALVDYVHNRLSGIIPDIYECYLGQGRIRFIK